MLQTTQRGTQTGTHGPTSLGALSPRLNFTQSCLLATPTSTWFKWVNYQFVNYPSPHFSFFLLASVFAIYLLL